MPGITTLGHVGNVRSALLAREWAQVSDEGVFLSDPHALLDAWLKACQPPAGKRQTFYTTLHGSSFSDALRGWRSAATEVGHVALASFSAAQWLAPYGRTGTQYVHADAAGLAQLCTALQLSPASKGENVVVTVLDEPGLFRDTVEPAPGVLCTSPVQTYLDLASSSRCRR